VGFGVSKYARPELELAYAAKDAQDLEQLFVSMQSKQFAKVSTRVYVDEEVTPKSIASAKALLKDAKPEDVFVLFIAGHGVHDKDKEQTYYYLTHDADPNALARTAARFELIEELLHGIAPL